MKTGLVIGAVVLLTAGVSVGAYAFNQKRNGRPFIEIIPPAPKPALPVGAGGLNINTNPPGTTPATSTSVATGDALAAQAMAQQAAAQAAALAAQQAAAAAQQRALEVMQLKGTIAATENDQVIVLTQIRAITDSQNGLYDMEQRAYQELLNSQAFRDRVKACKDQVSRNCGFDLFGACNGDNQPKCENPAVDWSIQASWALPESRRVGAERFEADKQIRRRPLEAELQRLEVQYRGGVAELQSRYGEAFKSTRPEVHK